MIPNRAPDAPVEAMPVAAKFPPSTKPKMPEHIYTKKNRMGPIDISISLASVICSSMLKPMWMIPACKNIGRINRNHWFGCGSYLFSAMTVPGYTGFSLADMPKPQRLFSAQSSVDEVVLGQGHEIAPPETRF